MSKAVIEIWHDFEDDESLQSPVVSIDEILINGEDVHWRTIPWTVECWIKDLIVKNIKGRA